MLGGACVLFMFGGVDCWLEVIAGYSLDTDQFKRTAATDRLPLRGYHGVRPPFASDNKVIGNDSSDEGFRQISRLFVTRFIKRSMRSEGRTADSAAVWIERRSPEPDEYTEERPQGWRPLHVWMTWRLTAETQSMLGGGCC